MISHDEAPTKRSGTGIQIFKVIIVNGPRLNACSSVYHCHAWTCSVFEVWVWTPGCSSNRVRLALSVLRTCQRDIICSFSSMHVQGASLVENPL